MENKIQSRWKTGLLFFAYLLVVILMTKFIYFASVECHYSPQNEFLNLTGNGYHDENITSLWGKIWHRIQVQPFNLISFVIFFLAIIHTFFAPKINALSEKLKKKNIEANKKNVNSFSVECLKFLGEVEVIFGIWVIPLLIAMSYYYNWATALSYLSCRDYTEPLFVLVIMAVASSRPVVRLAEECIKFVARLGGESVTAWWLSLLTLGPLAGSLITEPGAMTISALLLAKQFYSLKPSKELAYATLGLLFVNISVGGVLTSFAAPPVLMVSKIWIWDTSFMFMNFGTKAFIGILCANILYFLLFRKELSSLDSKRKLYNEQNVKEEEEPIPFWISLTHIGLLAWMVVHSHFPVLFIGSFLFFIGFHKATAPYQYKLSLKTPILVAFFLAGLVIHGSLQAWWITILLTDISTFSMMFISIVLTAFNDNAEITFLASLIQDLSDIMKYAVVAGAVTGGGLTVIANAPNPLGQAILNKYFNRGIRPLYLFLAALPPTLLIALAFWFLRPHS